MDVGEATEAIDGYLNRPLHLGLVFERIVREGVACELVTPGCFFFLGEGQFAYLDSRYLPERIGTEGLSFNNPIQRDSQLLLNPSLAGLSLQASPEEAIVLQQVPHAHLEDGIVQGGNMQ